MTKRVEGLLCLKEVMERYGVSRTTLYRRMWARRFPAPTGKAGKGNWWSAQVLDEYDRRCRETSLKSVVVTAGNC